MTVVTLALLAAPALAEKPAEKTAAEKVRAPATVGELTSALRRYNAEETKLLEAEKISLPDLVAHWRKLDSLREGLERLDRKGVLRRSEGAERVNLRHELAQLLGNPMDVADLKGEFVQDKLEQADQARKRNLLGMAVIGNHSLEFQIKEILGQRVAGDAS